MSGLCRLTGITGGIGSGKSMVSRICRLLGYPVYDCDSRAKELMNSDVAVRDGIIRILGKNSYSESGEIDRRYISDAIFGDDKMLEAVNNLVHARVREDLVDWCRSRSQEKRVFVESAVFFSSGLNAMTDSVWVVEAGNSIRIARVCQRDNCDVEAVNARMEAQKREYDCQNIEHCYIIKNDDHDSLLCQVLDNLNLMF